MFPQVRDMSHKITKVLKGRLYRDYIGTAIGLIKGNTRDLDYSSYEGCWVGGSPKLPLGLRLTIYGSGVGV